MQHRLRGITTFWYRVTPRSVNPAAETSTLLHLLVSALVTMLQRQSRKLVQTSDGVTFTVHVAPKKIDKLIGTQGRTARRLRILPMSICKQNGECYSLTLDDLKRTAPVQSHVGPFTHELA